MVNQKKNEPLSVEFHLEIYMNYIKEHKATVWSFSNNIDSEWYQSVFSAISRLMKIACT